MSPVPPIVILGMHRSGTSMLAHALSECGVFLGSPENFVAAHETDNPEGYWEDRRAIEINDRILGIMGGTDQRPPVLPEGWEHNARLEECYTLGQDFVQSFNGRPIWGWKDPRTMLTLPFWLRICPEAKLLLIWRHPLKVALSLSRRSVHLDAHHVPTLQRSFYLWNRYNASALPTVRERGGAVTAYDRLRADFAGELARVCGELGIKATEEQLARAAATFKSQSSHERIFGADLLDEPFFTTEQRETYRALSRLCAPSAQETADKETLISDLLTLAVRQLADQAAEADGSWEKAKELREELDKLGDLRWWMDAELKTLRDFFDYECAKWQEEGNKWRLERDGWREEAEAAKADLARVISDGDSARGENEVLHKEKAVLEEKCAALEKQVGDILSSRSFRVGNRLLRFIGRG